jgi:hypothetical protein
MEIEQARGRQTERVSTRTRRLSIAASLLLLIVVLALTLAPASGTPPTAGFWCFACGELGALDVAANIVLFVPLGFALALATGRWWVAVAACIATTVAIEALQVGVVLGRDASFGDLLTNSLGGWIGVELALNRRALIHPEPSTARGLTIAWCALFVAICAATSWALRPAFVPRSLWVQWLPPRPGYEPFTGRLVAFDIEGIDLPLGFPSPSLGLSKHLMSDRWRATATIERDGLEPRRSVIVRISEEVVQPFALEQKGWDLTCQQRTRSADAHFRSPRVALRNGFLLSSGKSPDTLRLRCERHGAAIVASVEAGGQVREEILPLSPSLGWAVLSPFDIVVHGGTRWVCALWLIMLALPLGYWGALADGPDRRASRVWRRIALVGGVALAVGVALVVAPLLAGTAVGAWWEWAASLGGVAMGGTVARLAWGREARTRRAAYPDADGVRAPIAPAARS